MACGFSAPSHYLNQSWVIVNWTLRIKPVKFQSKYKTFHSWKCIWNYRLPIGGHYVQGEMSSGRPLEVASLGLWLMVRWWKNLITSIWYSAWMHMNKTEINTMGHWCWYNIDHNYLNLNGYEIQPKMFHKSTDFFRCSCITFSQPDLVSDSDYTDHIQPHEVLHLGPLLS